MKRLVVGNLKMNIISKVERENYSRAFLNVLTGKEFKDTHFIICPPFIHLENFSRNLKRDCVSIGAQDTHEEASGKFTGEISAPMIKNFGGDAVIIGHSERRKLFKESNLLINKKIKISLKNNLVPIICLGETRAQRDDGEIKKIISLQLEEGLRDISKAKISQLILAYEPIWAISDGKNANKELPSGDNIMEIRILIQKILTDKFGLNLKKMPQILYGGSVNFKNVEELCVKSGMDGVLVGGESLHPVDFIKIGEVLEK